MSTTRILVVDDQALVRGGFHMILEAEDDFEVVGEAADGLEALEAAERLRPDVFLMDIRMPHLDGVEATGADGQGAFQRRDCRRHLPGRDDGKDPCGQHKC